MTLTACLALLALAASPAPESLKLASVPSPDQLAELLWTRSPELVEARGRLHADAAEVERARLLPNPGADLAIGTVPIGQHNPPELPFSQIPNVSLTFSELFEIGKRGPRQQAAVASLTATRAEIAELVRQKFLDLDERIADVAASELRIERLRDLAADADAVAKTEEQRAQKGDTAGLDAERARLEAEKLVANLSSEEVNLAVALSECSRAAGVPCEGFGDGAKASAWLDQRLSAALPATAADVEQRPDVQALKAREAAAEASLALAHAKAIPDPSVRAGYTHDQFVASGNQANSLNFGVSFNLPTFDRGQADAALATAQADSAAMARGLVVALAMKDQERLAALARSYAKRRDELSKRSLPLARGIVDRLDRAVKAGGAVLQDLLLARRTLGELLLDAADLEVAAYKNRVALARAGGEAPPMPRELAPRP